MVLPKSLTTVTTFSKLIALFLFILLPFAGFYVGLQYQQMTDGPKFETKSASSALQNNPSTITPGANQKQTTYTPQTIEGWQRYTSDMYGYSFQYPPNWFLNKTDVRNIDLFNFDTTVSGQPIEGFTSGELKLEISAGTPLPDTSTFQQTSFAGEKAYTEITDNQKGENEMLTSAGERKTEQIFLQHSGQTFVVSVYFGTNTEDQESIVNQIFSTFGFADQMHSVISKEEAIQCLNQEAKKYYPGKKYTININSNDLNSKDGLGYGAEIDDQNGYVMGYFFVNKYTCAARIVPPQG